MKAKHSLSILSLVSKSAVAVIFTLILGAAAFAQIDRADLEGTVTDPSGAAIGRASIKIVAADTGLASEQQTNTVGYYRFPGLAVGHYSVTVTSNGFKTTVVRNVILEVGETHTQDVKLPVGAPTERVEVTADELTNRTSAEAGTVIRPDQIADLANNGRDWTTLSLLAPFAQDDGGGDQRTIRFAGRARDDNNFSIDGVDAGGIQEQAQKSTTRLQISQDAIEEYRVDSALYDVEYGTQAGGQIDAETKSGTNDLHGTVFGYLRNSYFDARSFLDFDINGNPAISPFRMGQYGMSLSGPIVKNKTFFFINYEGIRQLQFNGQQMIVPAGICCANFLAGEPQGITEPYQKYVLDQAQSLGIGPTMCQIMGAFPWRASVGSIDGCTPRFVIPDGSFQWQGSSAAPNPLNNQDSVTVGRQTTIHEDTWLVRIDQKISDKTLLYGRAQRDISIWYAPATNPAVPGDNQATINHPANYMLALQHTFSPTVFNEAKLYINRSPFHNPGGSALPYNVTTNDFVTLNNTSADIEVGTTYGGIDNLTWVHGRHAFKAGMEIRRVRLNQGQTSNNVLTFGDDYSLAAASLSSIDYIAPWCCHRLRRTFYMPYFQDQFKVTPTFTFTAGVRWDYYGVATEATNRTTVFDLNEFHGVCLGSGSYNVAPSPGPTNTPACPKNPALYNHSYRNFDPRLSLAWAPEQYHGKTVFRAGYGIYHGAAQNDDLNAGLESDTFRILVNSPSPPNCPPPGTIDCANLQPQYAQQDPDLSSIPSTSKQGNHPRALQREGRRDLYVETWGLTIEQQLPANFLFSLQYIGSHGVHLFSRGAVNLCTEPVTINISNSFGVDCVRTLDPYYPNGNPFGSVDYKHDVGASTYDALGVSLERRLTNGLSFQSRYTWSHSINDGSVGGGESTGPENVNCLECDKGPSVYDVRNNIAVNTEYELPFGPGKPYVNHPGALGKIIGGWSLSSIGLWHTGHPLTVQMDLSGTIDPMVFPNSPFAQNGLTYNFLLPDGNDQTNQRPDIIPGVPVMLSHPHPAGPNGGGSPLVNAAAFQAPPLDANGNFTRFGNEPNGVIRAPNIWQIDLALTKKTKLTERLSLEFAVQAFNIFNHVQLADPLDLTLAYLPTQSNLQNLTAKGDFGFIDSSVNFNSNNDNAAPGNTGTGTPRQLQFMARFLF
jgi:carboxypeptidase family protein/TonB-dependent receptor-like protein